MDLALSEARNLPNLDREVSFSLEELFFSRTDTRGIILSGNSVFQRVSMYSWDELVNKPHKIIRHPDTPRGVFWLLWDTIKKGRPIGAYVKNRARDGRYYWVFAIVTPVESGYLSVRLKPSSMLSIVENEYRSANSAAAADKLSPEDGAAVLLRRLRELGFDNYNAFMATALSKELTARNEGLRRPPDSMISRFEKLVTASKSLITQADEIFAAFSRNQLVPLNLSVQAAQLGQAGNAIGVISSNYNIISEEIRNSMSQLVASTQEIVRTVNEGLFLLCVAKVQHEMVELFRAETSAEEHSYADEMVLLEKQQLAYQQKAKEGLREIAVKARCLQGDCSEMKKLASSLVVTRVMGKIESARLAIANRGLDELMNDLEAFQAVIARGLSEIERKNEDIQDNVGRLFQSMEGDTWVASAPLAVGL